MNFEKEEKSSYLSEKIYSPIRLSHLSTQLETRWRYLQPSALFGLSLEELIFD